MVLVRAVRREMAQRWEDDDGGELDSLAMAMRVAPAAAGEDER
jgi:hypothetical protein